MTLTIELIVISHFSIATLSLIAFVLLVQKWIQDGRRYYTVHSLIKTLSVLTFFLFIDGLYYCILYMSQYGMIHYKWFFLLSDPKLRIFPSIGIFFSTIALIYFVFDKKIEYFKFNEVAFHKLKKLNKELEDRARELEQSQDKLEEKVIELERFNDIAKEREQKMIELIKKIETLQTKIKKKA